MCDLGGLGKPLLLQALEDVATLGMKLSGWVVQFNPKLNPPLYGEVFVTSQYPVLRPWVEKSPKSYPRNPETLNPKP